MDKGLVHNLSVFFPAFNEEKNIAVTVEKAINVLKDLNLEKYEIIIIDDGSKDNTGKIADDLASKYSFVKVIHQKNGGYGMALRVGFSGASYDFVVYTDSDGQFDFSEVSKFLEKSKEVDVVYGYRLKRNDHFLRNITAKGWAFSVWFLFGLWMKDVDCGFKMINRKVLEKIPPLQSTRGGMINAELAIKAKDCGFKIAQVGVKHYPRLYGEPSGVKINVILQSYLDLTKLWLAAL